MTTIRALVLIRIGLAVGSLMRSVHAQTDVVLFQVGQRLNLLYISDEHSIDCTILEVRGSFVRCEPPKPPDTFTRFPTDVTWCNIATVRSVSIREPR